MRKAFGFSSFDIGLHLARIHHRVFGLVAASAILMSCGGGISGGGGSGSTGGGGNSDAGGGVGLTVALSSPASILYARGTVAVQVTVSGGTPDSVELLKDATLLAPLTPPYQYSWDTASTPEGSYQLVARATLGNQSFSSEPRTVVVDRTPPAIASRVPGPNATNILVDDPIVVGFTKALLPASVTPGAFALRSGGTPVPTTPLLSGDGKTVMLLRHNSLTVPATLMLTVSTSITDLAGNALAGANAWSWSVPDWAAVGRAINAVADQNTNDSPALVMDGSGKPLVAFSESDGSHNNVYVQRWTGSSWQSVGIGVNAVLGQDASHPALALDGSGNPVVAFREYDGTHRNIYVQRWTGSTWQPVGGAVNAVPGQDVPEQEPAQALALDGSGNPVVAFSESNGSHNNLYVQRWTGSAWQSVGGAINAVPGQDIFYPPALALNASGNPVVAFFEFDGSYFNVYVRHWSGSVWQSVGGAVNAVQGQNPFWIALVLDGSGNPVVAFTEFDGAHYYNVYVQRWTGSTWQSVGGAVNAVPGHSVFGPPALALDGSGKAVVAFQESDGSRRSVYVQRRTDIIWQSVGSAVNAVPQQDVFATALALDGAGKPVVAVYESDGTHFNVYVRHSNQ